MNDLVKFSSIGELVYDSKNKEVVVTIKNTNLKFKENNGKYEKIDYTTEELNELIEKCNFNEENGEIEILKLRNKGKSLTSISLELNMSISTISRRISSIKNKINKIKKK